MRAGLALVGLLAAVAAGTPVAALPPPESSAAYVAAGAYGDPGLGAQVVDCSGTLGVLGVGNVGGACLPIPASGSREPPDTFVLFAYDWVTATPPLVAGFDLDGDGCLGCVPGADRLWVAGTNGFSFPSSFLAGPVLGDVLVVAVPAVAHRQGQAVNVATSGVLRLYAYATGQPPSDCQGGRFGGGAPCHAVADALPQPVLCLGGCRATTAAP